MLRSTWAVNELVAAYDAVKENQIKDLIEDYKAKYEIAPELLDKDYDSLFIAAREECAMVNMMRANGCTAGVDNFEDLGALPQLLVWGRSASHPNMAGVSLPKVTGRRQCSCASGP